MGESSASRHVLDKIKEHVAASLRAAQLNAINGKATPNELISGTDDVYGHPINFHRISSTPRVLPPAKDNKNSLPTPPGSPHDLTLNVPPLPVPPPWPASSYHQSPSSSAVNTSLDFLHVNTKSLSSSIATNTNSSTSLSQFGPSSVVIAGHHVHRQSQRQHQHQGPVSQVVASSESTAALGGPTTPSPLTGLSLIAQHHHHQDLESPIIARALASSMPKRPRGEKHPIPEEQKDDKYFERRKRNNQAAKKSRDARKMREDEIAFRANILEKENAILRAQVATLREEANSLRQLLMQKRHSRFQVL